MGHRVGPDPVEGRVTAVERLYDLLSERGTVRGRPEKFQAQCPAHPDSKPSLSVAVGEAGDRAILKCFADCSTDDVLAALGLTATDLFDEPREPNGHSEPQPQGEWTPSGPAVAVYDYVDERGELLFQVLRTADKKFLQRRPDATRKTGWSWKLDGVRRVPFRLPELIDAVKNGHSVYIAEGEKDVLNLVAAGKVATCNPGGAGNGKWRPEYTQYFADADVLIFADKDTVGQAHARAVAQALADVASRVWVLEAPDPHKDVSDMLAAGLSVNDALVTVNPSTPLKPDLAPDLLDLIESGPASYDWLVPGLLERGDRLMLTGVEGLGKSHLIRQLVVCLGAGCHPFTFEMIEPLRILLVDCENSEKQNRRKYWPVWDHARLQGFPLPRGQVHAICRPEGKNLTDTDDAAWLLERAVAHKPDVLVVGPLYQLHSDNPNSEETARKIAGAINTVRTELGCAVIIENHAGHGDGSKVHRPIRPVGSSLWLRWPEFGYGLRAIEEQAEFEIEDVTRVDFKAWRGPRDERDWPKRLVRPTFERRRDGGFWPWVVPWMADGPVYEKA